VYQPKYYYKNLVFKFVQRFIQKFVITRKSNLQFVENLNACDTDRKLKSDSWNLVGARVFVSLVFLSNVLVMGNLLYYANIIF